MPDLSAVAVNTWLNHTDPNPISDLPDALRRAELEPSVETALVALASPSTTQQRPEARATYPSAFKPIPHAPLFNPFSLNLEVPVFFVSSIGFRNRASLSGTPCSRRFSRLMPATPHRPSSLPSNFSPGALLSLA